MIINQERFTTYKSLSPVLRTQTTCEMLALHRRLATARTEHEQTNLKRQLDAADRQIDLLVYDLYNLTEEEIRIVEKD